MPFIEYVPKRFHAKSELEIDRANAIFAEYAELGLTLTLRQLYYQFVSRDFIPNNMKSYNRLKGLINDARLAGRIDWHSIEDRTRNLQSWSNTEDPAEAIRDAAELYRENKWEDQPTHVEVWVEKDALLGVIEMACRKYQTPFFSCRGYTSQSEVWNSAQRLANLTKPCVILHLGDHDPSGVDMSRDIADRMELFEAHNVTLQRIALTMEQVRARRPPPNPAKLTDSRVKEYIKNFGNKSWELDALDPKYLINLIETHTEAHLDAKRWKRAVDRETNNRAALLDLSGEFELAAKFVQDFDAMQWFRGKLEDES